MFGKILVNITFQKFCSAWFMKWTWKFPTNCVRPHPPENLWTWKFLISEKSNLQKPLEQIFRGVRGDKIDQLAKFQIFQHQNSNVLMPELIVWNSKFQMVYTTWPTTIFTFCILWLNTITYFIFTTNFTTWQTIHYAQTIHYITLRLSTTTSNNLNNNTNF